MDKNYILYAVGLLSQDYPDEALRFAKKYLVPVSRQETGAVDVAEYVHKQSVDQFQDLNAHAACHMGSFGC